MSAVLKFPDRMGHAERNALAAANEAAELAYRQEYGLRATQQFQRRAYHIARQNPHLSPAACAEQAVPHKSTTLGEWGDLPEPA